MLFAFFYWWYGPGWTRQLHALSSRSHHISQSFSMPMLSRTLFSPWRRIISYGGNNIADNFRAMLDNAFSRCVGFVVRLFVLLGGLFSIAVAGILTVVQILIWPLVPVLPVVLVILGVSHL